MRKGRITHARRARGGKDEAAQVGSALVAESAGGVDESSNTIRLQGRADEGGAPGNGSTRGLARLDELLLGVGNLGALVCLAEDGAQHGQLDRVVEDGAKGDGRGLDRGEVWEKRRIVSMMQRKVGCSSCCSISRLEFWSPSGFPMCE